MDFSKLLNQVFTSAKDAASNGLIKGNSTQDNIAKIGGGAAVVGLISMMLGRNGGSGLAKLGSLAALGSLAYQAYQKYQSQQTDTTISNQAQFEEVDENTASKTILQVMIAAASADGVISEEEKSAIFAQSGENSELAQWLEQEINHPISLDEIAQQVGNNQALATQVYLAARMVCKDLDRKEIIFLSDLAQALGLPDALVEQLEKDAGF